MYFKVEMTKLKCSLGIGFDLCRSLLGHRDPMWMEQTAYKYEGTSDMTA